MILQNLTRKRFIKLLNSNRVFLEEGKNCLNILHTMSSFQLTLQKNKIEGRILVTFVVEHDGSISNVNVANSVYPSLDKESIRVVSGMPKWIPGKANGKTVRVKYTIPITFRLN